MTDPTFEPIKAIASPPPQPPPPEALKAKSCSCDEPWIERDVEYEAHCVRCGRSL